MRETYGANLNKASKLYSKEQIKAAANVKKEAEEEARLNSKNRAISYVYTTILYFSWLYLILC